MAVAAVGRSPPASTASTRTGAPAMRVARAWRAHSTRRTRILHAAACTPARSCRWRRLSRHSSSRRSAPTSRCCSSTCGQRWLYNRRERVQILESRDGTDARGVGHIARALEQLLRHRSRVAPTWPSSELLACAPCALLRDDYVKLFRHYEAPLLGLTTWPKCSRWTSPAASIRTRAGTRSWRRPSSTNCARAGRAAQEAPAAAGPLPSARAPLWPEASCLPCACPGSDGPRPGGGGGGRARRLGHVRTAAGCRLHADRENKPVDPGSGAASAAADRHLPVRFGAQPRLLISYLRSYEGFGDAQLTVSRPCAECQWGKYPIGHPYTLIGRHALRTSQATSEFEASSTFAQDVAPTAESALEGRAHPATRAAPASPCRPTRAASRRCGFDDRARRRPAGSRSSPS